MAQMNDRIADYNEHIGPLAISLMDQIDEELSRSSQDAHQDAAAEKARCRRGLDAAFKQAQKDAGEFATTLLF